MPVKLVKRSHRRLAKRCRRRLTRTSSEKRRRRNRRRIWRRRRRDAREHQARHTKLLSVEPRRVRFWNPLTHITRILMSTRTLPRVIFGRRQLGNGVQRSSRERKRERGGERERERERWRRIDIEVSSPRVNFTCVLPLSPSRSNLSPEFRAGALSFFLPLAQRTLFLHRRRQQKPRLPLPPSRTHSRSGKT